MFVFLSAIKSQQTTVLPNAVAALNMPVSCVSNASTALRWFSRSSPLNET